MATKKLSAVIQIGGALDGSLKGALGQGAKAINKLGDAIKQLGKEQDRIKKAAALEEQLKKDSIATGKAYVKLQQLRREVEASGGANQKLNASLKQAEQNLYQLAAAEGRTKAKLIELRSELQKAGHDTDDLTRANKRLGDAMAKLNARRTKLQAREQLKSDLQARQGDLMGPFMGSAAVVGAMAFPVHEAIKYESEMAEVRKTVGGTVQQTNALGESLRNLTLEMPGTKREEVTKVAALAGQAGVASKDIKGYTRDAIMLGKAFGLSSEEGSDALQSFRAALKLNQREAIRLADAINLLGNNFEGVVSERGLTEFIQRQGSTLKAGGLKTNEIAALGAAMLAPGTAPEVAATGAKNMTNALTKGEAATKGQRWAMGMLGLDPVSMAKAMQQNAPKAILTTLDRIAKQPKFRQSAIVSKLFGEESKGAIMPLLTNTGSLIKAFNQVAREEQYAGSMMREYGNQTDQTGARLTSLGESLRDINTTIGTELSGALDSASSSLKPVVDGIGKWAKENPRLTRTITMVVGGVAGAIAIVTGLGLAVTGVKLAMMGLGAAMGPIGWTMVGLGLVAGVVIANWDKIGPVIGRAAKVASFWMGDLGKKFPWLKGVVGMAWEAIKRTLEWSPLGVIIRYWKPAFDWLTEHTGLIGQQLKWIFNGPGAMPTGSPNTPQNPAKTPPPSNVVPFPTSRPAGGTKVYTDNSKFSITINPAGNLNEAAMAMTMRQEIERIRAQQRRGALHD